MKLMRAAVLLGILVSVPLALLAQEIQIIPLEDLEDEPGLTIFIRWFRTKFQTLACFVHYNMALFPAII